jgi:hypothetical protein
MLTTSVTASKKKLVSSFKRKDFYNNLKRVADARARKSKLFARPRVMQKKKLPVQRNVSTLKQKILLQNPTKAHSPSQIRIPNFRHLDVYGAPEKWPDDDVVESPVQRPHSSTTSSCGPQLPHHARYPPPWKGSSCQTAAANSKTRPMSEEDNLINTDTLWQPSLDVVRQCPMLSSHYIYSSARSSSCYVGYLPAVAMACVCGHCGLPDGEGCQTQERANPEPASCEPFVNGGGPETADSLQHTVVGQQQHCSTPDAATCTFLDYESKSDTGELSLSKNMLTDSAKAAVH